MLQTYFITGTDLRVKDIKVDARGISAELETKASDLGDAMPYIVRPGAWLEAWLTLCIYQLAAPCSTGARLVCRSPSCAIFA